MNNAKRVCAAAALLILILCAPSCARAKRDMLAFLSYPLSADCTLTCTGEGEQPPAHFSLEITERGHGRLIFTDGELSGLVISVTPEGVEVTDGAGFSVPAELPEGAPAAAVVAAFSIDHTDVLAQTQESEGAEGRISAVCAGGTADISVSGGIPRAVSFGGPCGGFELTVEKFAGSPG